MVEQQGEMLNNIEKNVDAARDYVGAAERECSKAVDLTNQFRKVRSVKQHFLLVFWKFKIQYSFSGLYFMFVTNSSYT